MPNKTMPDQMVLVEAIAPAMVEYGLSGDEWLNVCLELRMLSRGSSARFVESGSMGAVFLEDIARAADAMHNRLNSQSPYSGEEALNRALGDGS